MASLPEYMRPEYAELHCRSNFTFLQGASFPEELVQQALTLGYQALALTDECSVSGVVRAHVAVKGSPLKLIIGTELGLEDGLRVVLLATNREGYGNLSYLITQARCNSKKGEYRLTRLELNASCLDHCLVLWLPSSTQTDIDEQELAWLSQRFPKNLWIAVELLLQGSDKQRLLLLQTLGQKYQLPLCASGDVHMHQRRRRILQDILTAIRKGCSIKELGLAAFSNAERYLRPRHRLEKIYPVELLQETTRIAGLCRFSLDELRYEYPSELVPTSHTAHSWLQHLVLQGMHQRWPNGIPEKIHTLVSHEMQLVGELRYEHYFLTVHDIVMFARRQGILCQGRGSAANSVICYCLGITAVDPARMQLLFERFISKERDEPPDIDVDFEHERREEVIQYIYEKYGRQRAALAATVITYQARSAVRDVGKALGMSLEQVDRIAKNFYWWHNLETARQQVADAGFSPDNPLLKRLLELVGQIIGFPRHLSQHVGGFVISQGLLSRLVPIENAAMAQRTVIQWEKNDLEALGLLKIDVLALGMLSAIRKALAYISAYSGKPLGLTDIPAEDPKVYAMLQRADTIGVFQIESRAQMSMLPRLRPANYYDLVIQIAIVRPGPIQGDMVHPYLARRAGKEQPTYHSEAIKQVLQRTLGIPIFQEQVMQLAMVAAGFTAGEADQLRRAMAAWKRRGGLEKFETKLLQGMAERGYPESFAQQIFKQIKGFGEYGFPESHSASFALLAYASSWLKCYHPVAFTCALLNSQPMGFYAASQLVQDAQRHGVVLLPIDVNHSQYDCHLEYQRSENKIDAGAARRSEPPLLAKTRAAENGSAENKADKIRSAESNSVETKPDNTSYTVKLRLGLRLVKGLGQQAAQNLVSQRDTPYQHVQDLATRSQLHKNDLEVLAAAGALASLTGDRHRAYWQVSGVEESNPLFGVPTFNEVEVMLPRPSEGADIVADYAQTGLTLGRHPLALLRRRLDQYQVSSAESLWQKETDSWVRTAGLVICRQRPGSANNVVFVTLEDETGQANIIVWPKLAEQQHKVLVKANLMIVHGALQQHDGVLHVIARRLEDWSHFLGDLNTSSRDFC